MAINGSGVNGHSGYFGKDGNLIGSGLANKKSVWTVTTKPFKEAHFATFPEDLIVDCIKAGCPEGGIVLDPFMGAGTSASSSIQNILRLQKTDYSTISACFNSMAEGKKTVVVYTDWGEIFDKLDEVEAGRLAKHFFDYIRDKDPVPGDRITEIAFQPMKNQLKRDLKAWEGTIVEKSQSGRLGNLKRYHPDLYKKVVNQKLTLEDAEVLAYATKTSLSDTVRQKPSQDVATVADNVNVTVNDKVSLLSIRKLKFADTLKPFLRSPENPDGYPKEFLNDFYAYWTEPNKSQTKFRQELEKTWDLGRRLRTWDKNNYGDKFSSKGQTQTTNASPGAQPVDK